MDSVSSLTSLSNDCLAHIGNYLWAEDWSCLVQCGSTSLNTRLSRHPIVSSLVFHVRNANYFRVYLLIGFAATHLPFVETMDFRIDAREVFTTDFLSNEELKVIESFNRKHSVPGFGHTRLKCIRLSDLRRNHSVDCGFAKSAGYHEKTVIDFSCLLLDYLGAKSVASPLFPNLREIDMNVRTPYIPDFWGSRADFFLRRHAPLLQRVSLPQWLLANGSFERFIPPMESLRLTAPLYSDYDTYIGDITNRKALFPTCDMYIGNITSRAAFIPLHNLSLIGVALSSESTTALAWALSSSVAAHNLVSLELIISSIPNASKASLELLYSALPPALTRLNLQGSHIELNMDMHLREGLNDFDVANEVLFKDERHLVTAATLPKSLKCITVSASWTYFFNVPQWWLCWPSQLQVNPWPPNPEGSKFSTEPLLAHIDHPPCNYTLKYFVMHHNTRLPLPAHKLMDNYRVWLQQWNSETLPLVIDADLLCFLTQLYRFDQAYVPPIPNVHVRDVRLAVSSLLGLISPDMLTSALKRLFAIFPCVTHIAIPPLTDKYPWSVDEYERHPMGFMTRDALWKRAKEGNAPSSHADDIVLDENADDTRMAARVDTTDHEHFGAAVQCILKAAPPTLQHFFLAALGGPAILSALPSTLRQLTLHNCYYTFTSTDCDALGHLSMLTHLSVSFVASFLVRKFMAGFISTMQALPRSIESFSLKCYGIEAEIDGPHEAFVLHELSFVLPPRLRRLSLLACSFRRSAIIQLAHNLASIPSRRFMTLELCTSITSYKYVDEVMLETVIPYYYAKVNPL